MTQTIDAFAKQNIALARMRGLTPLNPCKMLFRPNANDVTDQYIVVVADTEPSFADLPYNLIWVVSNRGDPQFQAVLRRTSHVSDGIHRASWITITNYNDVFASRQIYRRVVENASSMGIDPGDIQISHANTSKAGSVLLNIPSPVDGQALVVSDSDPRMGDARVPLEHDHDDYPRTKVRINSSQFVEINSSNAPQEGYVLAIVDVDPLNPNKFIGRWVKPTMDNVNWTSPRLLALRISLPGATSYMSDNSSVQMVSVAEYSDRVVQNPQGVEWTIEDNSLGVTISQLGVVTAPDLGFDVTLEVTARIQDPVYGNWIETKYPLLIKDLYLEDDTLVRITISGPTTMFAGQREVFGVTAHYASGNKVPIIPLDFVSDNQALVLDGMFGTAQATPTDQIATITATYNFDGVDYTATHQVTVKAQKLVKLEIQGPDMLLSEKSGEYKFRVQWSNGVWEYITPNTFIADPANYTTINRNKVTAKKETNVDRNVVLKATYTAGGSSIDGASALLIKHVPIPATLSELIINGATIMQENSSTSYTFTAKYSDGTIKTVNPLTFTTSRPDVSTISGNTVTSGPVNQDTQTILTATYEEAGITKTATLNLTVLNVEASADLVSIRITGSNSVPQNTRADYKVIATYSDSSQKDITNPDEFKLARPSDYATVQGLTLIVGTVPVPVSPVTLTATYQENGIRRTANYPVSLTGSNPVPVSLAIEGPNQVDELSQAQYNARVTMSDSTTYLTPAVWSVVQGNQFATINNNGMLNAGSVDKNEIVLIHAQAEGLVAEKSVTIANVLDVALTEAKIDEFVPPFKFNDVAGSERPLQTMLTFSNGDQRYGAADELVYKLSAEAAEFFTTIKVGTEWTIKATKDLNGFYGTKKLDLEVTATVAGRAVKNKLVIELIGPTDEVEDVFIRGDASISEGNIAEYSVIVKRLSGTETQYTASIPQWEIITGGAFAKLRAGTTDYTTKVYVETGIMTQNETCRLRASQIVIDGQTYSINKNINLIRDNTLPKKVTLIGPAQLSEGQRGAYKLKFEFESGAPIESEEIVVSWGNDGDADAVTFNGDNTVTAKKVATDTPVLLKGVGMLNGRQYTEFLFITVMGDTPTLERITVMGPAELRPDTKTQYRATAQYSDASTREVTNEVTWEATVTSGTYAVTVSTTGEVTVPAGTTDGAFTLTATLTGVTGTSTIQIKHEPVTTEYGPRFGWRKRITAESQFNKEFMESLTTPLTETGEQFVECPAGMSVSEGIEDSSQWTYFYVAWPARLGYGYFRDFTGGSYGFAGSWDGASQYEDELEPFENGGIKVTIEGKEYIVYRNDFAFEQVRYVYSILYGSNDPISGKP